ncbi:hypothetical protein QE152_g27416 [Popillia japonica]|uniref:Uncharacterized protein n=1 Tax=Popillia japonica TaxID=7064 RepID=A0AAW1JUH8_POPJA
MTRGATGRQKNYLYNLSCRRIKTVRHSMTRGATGRQKHYPDDVYSRSPCGKNITGFHYAVLFSPQRPRAKSKWTTSVKRRYSVSASTKDEEFSAGVNAVPQHEYP